MYLEEVTLHIRMSFSSIERHLFLYHVFQYLKEFTYGIPFILCILFNICEGKQLSPQATKARHCSTI